MTNGLTGSVVATRTVPLLAGGPGGEAGHQLEVVDHDPSHLGRQDGARVVHHLDVTGVKRVLVESHRHVVGNVRLWAHREGDARTVLVRHGVGCFHQLRVSRK